MIIYEHDQFSKWSLYPDIQTCVLNLHTVSNAATDNIGLESSSL